MLFNSLDVPFEFESSPLVDETQQTEMQQQSEPFPV